MFVLFYFILYCKSEKLGVSFVKEDTTMRTNIWAKLCLLQGVAALNVGPEYSHPIESRLIAHIHI